MSQEKSKTMPMQIIWGIREVYYGIVQVENLLKRYKNIQYRSLSKVINKWEKNIIAIAIKRDLILWTLKIFPCETDLFRYVHCNVRHI